MQPSEPCCILQDDELDFAEQQKQAAIQHKQQWEHDSAEKQRLVKMQDDHHQFQDQIVSRRQGEFEELQVVTCIIGIETCTPFVVDNCHEPAYSQLVCIGSMG